VGRASPVKGTEARLDVCDDGIQTETEMKALAWHGKNDIRCDSVPDPTIEDARDAIIKVTACAICGSDLHLFDGIMPTMEKGDVLGHETMGEVVEVGSQTKKLKVGDRVVVPFTIACGECFFCKNGFFSGCERSNPNHKTAETIGGLLDKIPMGSAINRGLTFRMAQTPVQHYLPQLLGRIEKGEIDPSFVITHRATLEEGPELYKTFRAKNDGCIKVVMKPS
jgi:threonine dehydrogenase-like Zn-dependent dehydrogenase